MKKLGPVFRVLYWILMIYLLTGEPLQFWRKPLTEDQVKNALPKGYLSSFYEQADELDFYSIDRKTPVSWIADENVACFFQYNIYTFWKSKDIYVIREQYASEQELLDYHSCLAHEIGHAVDLSNGNISETEEFQEAVELAIEMSENNRSGSCSWCFITEQIIAQFPGINGNPLLDTPSKGGWGGYKELYASMFAYGFSLDLLPPPLRIYYQDYLP